jgi:hypothetical protein
MLRLNASFAKKVPAELEYSSKSYMASLEVELPTNLNPEQLKAEIQRTYERLEDAVESQIAGDTPRRSSRPQKRSQNRPDASAEKATNKQIQFILKLGQEQRKGLPDLNAIADEQFQTPTIYDLTKRDASRMVDVLKQAA